MGTKCAPAHANVYLGDWEARLYSAERTSLVYLKGFWPRYIDIVLVLWTGTKQEV